MDFYADGLKPLRMGVDIRDKETRGIMTYEELLYLKFKKGIWTYDLVRQFPDDIARVSEVALLDVPEATLRQVVIEEKTLNKLKRLKRKFQNFLL